MDQTTARALAKELTDDATGRIVVASTINAWRGRWESGPDAYVWGVYRYPTSPRFYTDEAQARAVLGGGA